MLYQTNIFGCNSAFYCNQMYARLNLDKFGEKKWTFEEKLLFLRGVIKKVTISFRPTRSLCV